MTCTACPEGTSCIHKAAIKSGLVEALDSRGVWVGTDQFSSFVIGGNACSVSVLVSLFQRNQLLRLMRTLHGFTGVSAGVFVRPSFEHFVYLDKGVSVLVTTSIRAHGDKTIDDVFRAMQYLYAEVEHSEVPQQRMYFIPRTMDAIKHS